MKRKFDEKLIAAIKANERITNIDGVDYLIKPIPEGAQDGELDPRFLKMVKGMYFMLKFLPKNRDKPLSDMVGLMRKMFNKAKSIKNWNDGVVVGNVDVPCADGYSAKMLTYKRNNARADLPIFYYIHGGGFFGGSTRVVDQMCKFLVQNYDCLVFSIDYRLCPENHYPTPIDDCYSALNWIYDNAESLGGDKTKIAIGGDSAGGNAASVCALRDRDAGISRINLQYLIYPTVNMSGENTKYFDGATMDKYAVVESQKKYLAIMINVFSKLITSVGDIYLQGHAKASDPYVSPIFADLRNLPPTNLYFGEFDFLYFEDVAYARHLLDAGNKVAVTLYKGMSHGFVDQMGVNPQAEDLMSEIALSLKQHFN